MLEVEVRLTLLVHVRLTLLVHDRLTLLIDIIFIPPPWPSG